MYARVFSSSGDPGGRGPNSTCFRTYSKARAASKSLLAGAFVTGVDELSSAGLFELLGQPSNKTSEANAIECETVFNSLLVDILMTDIFVGWRFYQRRVLFAACATSSLRAVSFSDFWRQSAHTPII